MTTASSTFHFYRPGAVLRVSGEDAFTFLQGQFSNQLQHPVGSAVYGLWLNQKGKVLADSTVLRLGENDFLLTSEGASAAVIRERLEAYIIADDVMIADQSVECAGLVVAGAEGVAEVNAEFGGLPPQGSFLAREDVFIWAGRGALGRHCEVVGLSSRVMDFARKLAAAGVCEIDGVAATVARIEAGVPAVPVDIGPGDLPNEGGLDNTAISYTKGCYLGQEVMARLKNLGQVRRQLCRVRGIGAPPPSLAGLYQGTEKVGDVRSVAPRGDGYVALAMCSLVKLKAGANLSLSPEGEANVEVLDRG